MEGATATFVKETLPGGMRVVVEPIPHVRSVAVGLWYGVGSRHEDETTSGLSHFLEHMFFKGTARRSARDIAETMDQVGGQLNAVTTKEYTCIYTRVLDEHFPIGLDVIADMALNSRLDPQDVEREKGIILEEIKLYEDTPDEQIHDFLVQTMWDGHALGRSVLGTAEAVQAFDVAEVARFFDTYYRPANMVVGVAGNVDPPVVVNSVAAAFDGRQGGARPSEGGAPTRAVRREVRRKDTEQVHLAVGGTGVPLEHPDMYGLQLVSMILGGGPSSRLFQEIREERGLAYSVYSYTASYRDGGLSAIYAGVSPRHAASVLELVQAELLALSSGGIKEMELQRARDQVKAAMVMSLESTSSRMSRLARGELMLGRVLDTDEIIARIDAVTLDDAHRIADALLGPNELTVCAIGPVHPDLAPI
ncbi:MAG TPA: peptidase M16 [Clostridiales bacterium]|nr:peptidase M16 [Clostridiales bacterium]